MSFSSGMPAAEVTLTEQLVSGLLEDQHADLAKLPRQQVESGWDNAMFRLGDHLAVRLPRRAVAARLIGHEQRWLPELAKSLPIPVPVPERIGKPALGYPWPWSVVPWLPGITADRNEPDASQAAPFAEFLRSLHLRPPGDAPTNSLRGVPLSQRACSLEPRMQRLADRTDFITPRITQIWNEALAAPLDRTATWLHGDLHLRNVLVDEGIISGIIDWGDICSGDCATDLAAIWMLFNEPKAQHEALVAYGVVSEATVRRAKGWAMFFGVVLLDTGLSDNPSNVALGERILRRVEKGV